jgi:hypothetical protein
MVNGIMNLEDKMQSRWPSTKLNFFLGFIPFYHVVYYAVKIIENYLVQWEGAGNE